jgi:hypothetical protein
MTGLVNSQLIADDQDYRTMVEQAVFERRHVSQ